MSYIDDKLNEQKGISRRGFLKGTAVVMTAGVADSLIPDSLANASATDSLNKDSRTTVKYSQIPVDVCVIGAGGAGLTAAGSVLDNGVKNIIVLEKTGRTGGNVPAGMFGVESPIQKRLGIHITADECFKYHMNMHNWYCDAKLVRNWLTGIGDVIGWLENKGVEFTRVDSFLHERLMKHHHYTNGSVGQAIAKAMLNIFNENGVKVRFNTRATKLLTNRNGDVIGVVAKAGDEELTISAKAVILATGSISSNDALKARFYPGQNLSHVDIMANQGFPTGDGLIMAEGVGAASTHISTLYIGPHGHNTNEQVGALMRRPHLPKVNRLGYRFCNEDLGVTNEFGWMFPLAVDRQPDKVSYSLMDTSILNEYKRTKKLYSKFDQSGPRLDKDAFNRETERRKQALTDEKVAREEYAAQFEEKRADWLDTVEEDIQYEVKEGRAKVADNWDEIAQYIGCDPVILKNTVMDYNSFCLNKYDNEFLKMPEYLWPLLSPPYYAFQGYSGIDTCIGGLKTNFKLEVEDKKANPIKGLYAAGVMVGNWLGVGYGFYGYECSFTQYSGYTAGKNAAKFVLKKT